MSGTRVFFHQEKSEECTIFPGMPDFYFLGVNHMSVVPFLGHSISITEEKNQVVMAKLHNFPPF